MGKNTKRKFNSSGTTDQDLLDSYIEKKVNKSQNSPQNNSKPSQKIGRFILIAVILFAGFHVMRTFTSNSGFLSGTNPVELVESVIGATTAPSQDLLNRMNELMIEMGYMDLTDDDLRSLRSDGVSATYISNIRSLGYVDLSLNDARRLARADVSSAFTAMMIELGYELTVDDLVELRNAGVTAFFTSNMHDLGYRNVTKEQLIRMKRIGLTTSLVEQLQAERGEDIPLEDVIRYRISNQ